jgi:predicted aspartyl protease
MMGTFRYPVTLLSLDRTQRVTLEILVDTGATYTWVPEPVLQQLGYQPAFRRRLRLANGQIIERSGCEAVVEIDGNALTTIVLFGDPASEPLLGAVTLEQFSLAPRSRLPTAHPCGSLADVFGVRRWRAESL